MRFIMEIEARVEIEAYNEGEAYAKLDEMPFGDIPTCSIKLRRVRE